MSSSAKDAKRQEHTDSAPYTPPLTASSPSLLRSGSDRLFQELVFNLFTISTRLEQVRSHLASSTQISGPQYSLLRAVAALQGDEGVSVGAVAEHLSVSSAFVTIQSRLLHHRGFLKKREQSTDRRVSLLSLTPKGETLVSKVIEEVRPINDIFFGTLDRAEFDALSAITHKLVASSRDAMVHLSSVTHEAFLSTRDKGLSLRRPPKEMSRRPKV
jgi:DNA-binding MarR family transcriptional regulator